MNNKVVSCIASFLFFCMASAQIEKDSLQLKLNLCFKNQPLLLNHSYSSKTDSLEISMLKFYISGLELQYKDGSSYTEQNSFHLIDASDKNTLQINLPNKNEINKVQFNIGIDSTTSVSGALSGDLDVQNGMYWAWQSGYINLKLEGKSNSCKTRKNAFQFHIGGYLHPYCALRKVSINLNDKRKNEVSIKMDVSKLLENINLAETNSIMIPGKEAMKIADLSTKMFSVE